MRFCGLQLEEDVPDHIGLVRRFRKALSESGTWEVLLQQINTHLTRHRVLVKQGTMVDASVIPTLRKPQGRKIYSIQPEGPRAHAAFSTTRGRPSSQMGQAVGLQVPLPR